MKNPRLFAFVCLILLALHRVTLGADRTVVLLSVDGLAHFYFNDSKAPMPTIRRLAAEGAWAERGMLPVMPTVTWPNHTTLVTGVTPARHGVTGNVVYDRDTKKVIPYLWDPLLDKTQIVKVPAVYDVAKAAGMQTAAVTWPATRNAPTLDWTLPDVGTQALFDRYSTPALLKECADAGIATDTAGAWFSKGDFLDRDRLATRAFNLILHVHRPRLALLHLLNVDHVEHVTGPSTADVYEAIKEADDRVTDVWETLKKDFGDSATLVVVSDHGFLPYRQVSFPEVALREARTILANNQRFVPPKWLRAVSQGGSTFLYRVDGQTGGSAMEEVAKLFESDKAIQRVILPRDFSQYGLPDPAISSTAPDMVLSANEGYVFGDGEIGTGLTPPSDTPRGMHGYDNHEPAMLATFVAWGAGVEPGGKLGAIENLDVAPTLATLLKLEMKDVDGKPLSLGKP